MRLNAQPVSTNARGMRPSRGTASSPVPVQGHMRNVRFFTTLCVTALLASCARAPAPPALDLAPPTSAPTTTLPARPTPSSAGTAQPLDPTRTTPALGATAAVSTRTPGVTGTPLPAAHLKLDCLDVLNERPARLA